MSYKMQRAMGRKVEREHLPYFRKIKKDFAKKGKCPSDEQFVEGILSAHLKEDKKYYSKLQKVGL